jgi:organic radical activating enzyme
MRGEPQNLDMSEEVLRAAFDNCDNIAHLALTGGEPFLAPEVIEKMVDIIINKNIKVWKCATVDNGTILDDRGIRSVQALNRLGDYIYNNVWTDSDKAESERNPISISISNSKYHINDVQEALDFYKTYASEHTEVEDQGEWETELKDKQGNPIKNKDIKGEGRWLKKEGRAKENNLKNAKYITDTYKIECYIGEDGKSCVTTGIQICANGNVVPIEPLSFETMDSKNMGNILDEPLSCLIFKWNYSEPLSRLEVMEYCKNMEAIENPRIPEEIKKEKKGQNSYLDAKKLCLVEGHKDYPYLTRDELNIAAVTYLALMILDTLGEDGLKDAGLTDEELIQIIIEHEATGEYTHKFTRSDLELICEGMVDLNNERLFKERGLLGGLKHQLSILCKNAAYVKAKPNVSVYEK